MIRQSKHGFTLIELLVVISIISLLIALLLPALGGSRQTADSMACLAKMRGMGIAQTQYANDWRGFMPLASWDSDGIGPTGAASWPSNDPNYTVGNNDKSNYYYTYLPLDNTLAGPFMCPTYAKDGISPNRISTGFAELRVSYSYNFRVGGTYTGVLTTPSWLYVAVNLDVIRKPSTKAFLIDGVYRSTTKCDYALYTFQPAQTTIQDSPMGRHFGGTDNLTFFDGHASNRTAVDIYNNQTFWTSLP